MMKKPPEIDSAYRFEIKVPLQQNQYTEFLPFLYQLGIYPEKHYANRVVHSVYIDTPNFSDYQQNIAGISNRRKTRLRWYNQSPEKMSLEIKLKKNKVSRKHVRELENHGEIIPDTYFNLRKIQSLNKSIYEVKDICGLYPTLEVEYLRSYFKLTNKIRMTVDRKIKYRKLYPIRQSSFVLSPVHYVIEFKCPQDEIYSLKNMLTGLPYRIFRHSKYVVGMDTVY